MRDVRVTVAVERHWKIFNRLSLRGFSTVVVVMSTRPTSPAPGASGARRADEDQMTPALTAESLAARKKLRMFHE